jgi:hypothetical protein
MKKQTWTVQFSVSENWVADGFEMTDELALDMLAHRLGFAYESELGAKVIKSPAQTRILKLQGYEVQS